MTMDEDAYGQAVRRCQEFGVTIDMLPLRERIPSRNSFHPEDDHFEDMCNTCGLLSIVNFFGYCSKCATT